MARAKAPCGEYSAYRRHMRDKTPVDAACRAAQVRYAAAQREARESNADTGAPVVHLPPPSRKATFVLDQRAELVENLELVKTAMESVARDDPSKLGPLSKRRSEIVTEIAAFDGAGTAEVDPFDAFLASGNVVGITTASSRK